MGVAKEILGEAVKNVKKVGISKGSYLQAAAKGAATMGAIGGVSEWAQGGSFVAGAKSNLVSGAALGMAGRAVNIGINGADYGSATIGSTYNRASGRVSNSVKTLYKNAENTREVTNVMQNGLLRGRGQVTRYGNKGIPRVNKKKIRKQMRVKASTLDPTLNPNWQGPLEKI